MVDENGNESPSKDFDIFQGNEVPVASSVTALGPVEVDTKELIQLKQ